MLPDVSSQMEQPSPLLSFSVWLGLIGVGFFYVASVLCGRGFPLRSGNNEALDFWMVMLVGSCLYGIGPRFNWPPSSRSWKYILRWNGLGYVLPFFITLHWELWTNALGAQFSLKASDLGALSPIWIWVLIILAALLSGLLTAHLFWAQQAKRLPIYCVWLLGVPCLVAWVGWRLDDGAYLHVHHYCLGIYMLPLTPFRNFISLIAQAVFLGLFVEGISRWGMDPLWYA